MGNTKKYISIFIDDVIRGTNLAIADALSDNFSEETFFTLDTFNFSNFFNSTELLDEFLSNNMFNIIGGADAKYNGVINDFLHVKNVLNSEGYIFRFVCISKNNKEVGANLFFLSKMVIDTDEIVFVKTDDEFYSNYNDNAFILTANYKHLKHNDNIMNGTMIINKNDYNIKYIDEYTSDLLNNTIYTIDKIEELPKIVFGIK